jgi:hypothetical protein
LLLYPTFWWSGLYQGNVPTFWKTISFDLFEYLKPCYFDIIQNTTLLGFFSIVLQSSSSDIFVSWESFTDVEEYKKTVHKSGIKEYQVGVGRYNIVQIFRFHLFFLNVPVIFWQSSLGPVAYLLSRPFKLFNFQYFETYGLAWWRSFQTRVMFTKLDFYFLLEHSIVSIQSL